MTLTTDAHGESMTNHTNDDGGWGFKITTNIQCWVTKVTKHANSEATDCRIEDSAHNVLATSTYSGVDATFNNVALSNGGTYFVLNSKSVNWFHNQKDSTTFPINKTNVNFVKGVLHDTTEYAGSFDVISITTSDVGPATGTNSFINIGDQFKQISAQYINIADSWKKVATEYINIGDVWKKVF